MMMIRKTTRTNRFQIIKIAEMRLTLFVTGAFVDGVTLSALGSEDLLTGLGVSWWCFIERRHFRWGEN